MTGDLVTHRLLQGIAIILFGISLSIVGGGAFGISLSFVGLFIAATARSAAPRP